MVNWIIEYEHSGENYETVDVRVQDLMRDFQRSAQFNIEGQNPLGDSPVARAKRGHYEEILKRATNDWFSRVGMPAMGLDRDQNPTFLNGRHRFAAIFNQHSLTPEVAEYATIPIRVPSGDAPIFRQRWGGSK